MKTTEHYLTLEGMVVAEVADTEHGLEVQRLKRGMLVLYGPGGASKILYLSDYRDATGQTLEQALASFPDEIDILVDEARKKEELPW